MPRQYTNTTITDTDTERLQRLLQDRLPPYAVVLYNDDHNAMDFVVAALIESVPSLELEAAVEIMFEAHNTGSAVVIVCPFEQAEHYRDRIRSHGLGCDVRKA